VRGLLVHAPLEAFARHLCLHATDETRRRARASRIARDGTHAWREDTRLDLLAEAEASGTLESSAAAVEAKWRRLAEAGVPRPSFADVDLAAMEWYQATLRPVRGDLTDHAHELGFEDARDLLTAIAAEYLAREGA
jgi:hypothetical protein